MTDETKLSEGSELPASPAPSTEPAPAAPEAEAPAPEETAPAVEATSPAPAAEAPVPTADLATKPDAPAEPDSAKPFVSGERTGSRAETAAAPVRAADLATDKDLAAPAAGDAGEIMGQAMAEGADRLANQKDAERELKQSAPTLEALFIEFLEAMGPLNSAATQARRALVERLQRGA